MGPKALARPVLLVAARDLNSRRGRRISYSRIAAALSASRLLSGISPIARGGPDMGVSGANLEAL